jgi:hypothetical protein
MVDFPYLCKVTEGVRAINMGIIMVERIIFQLMEVINMVMPNFSNPRLVEFPTHFQ